MENISEWTDSKKMKLNEKKTQVMIFNFTEKLLETIQETKLLGTIVSSDLKWHANSDLLTKRGYQRMSILRKLYEFDIPTEDLVLIYNQYIRSILEFSSTVWFSSITKEERENIERVQRVACQIILKEDYINYNQALKTLNLQNLSEKRQMLAERFATKCAASDRFTELFPLNSNLNNIRNSEKYAVKFAHTDRLKDSSIPAMQRILNRKSSK